jgi:hypothetical protein
MAMDLNQGQKVGRVHRPDFEDEFMPAAACNADLFQKRGPGRPSMAQAIKDWVI